MAADRELPSLLILAVRLQRLLKSCKRLCPVALVVADEGPLVQQGRIVRQRGQRFVRSGGGSGKVTLQPIAGDRKLPGLLILGIRLQRLLKSCERLCPVALVVADKRPLVQQDRTVRQHRQRFVHRGGSSGKVAQQPVTADRELPSPLILGVRLERLLKSCERPPPLALVEADERSLVQQIRIVLQNRSRIV